MKHIPQLDGVRALAVLAVFLHHAYRVRGLWMGVDLFFILSGFLITGVLMRPHTVNLRAYIAGFYARRFRRLTVPYLLLLAIVTSIYGVSWMRHGYLYLGLMNFLKPLEIAYPAPFSVLWSLAVEEQFYLFWPLAVFFLSEKHLRWLAVFLVALAPLLRGTLHFHSSQAVYTLTPFRMDLLAVGALLCLQWRSNRASIERWGAKIGLAMIPIGLLIPVLLSRFVRTDLRLAFPVTYYEANLITCLGVMLWALSGWRVEWLKTRWLCYLGTISYTFYLFHTLALELIPTRVMAFVMTVAFASLSWVLIERPLLKGRNPAIAPTPLLQPFGAAQEWSSRLPLRRAAETSH